MEVPRGYVQNLSLAQSNLLGDGIYMMTRIYNLLSSYKIDIEVVQVARETYSPSGCCQKVPQKKTKELNKQEQQEVSVG